MPARFAQSFTMCQTTFSVTPLPQIEPVRRTHRNTRPSPMAGRGRGPARRATLGTAFAHLHGIGRATSERRRRGVGGARLKGEGGAAERPWARTSKRAAGKLLSPTVDRSGRLDFGALGHFPESPSFVRNAGTSAEDHSPEGDYTLLWLGEGSLENA